MGTTNEIPWLSRFGIKLTEAVFGSTSSTMGTMQLNIGARIGIAWLSQLGIKLKEAVGDACTLKEAGLFSQKALNEDLRMQSLRAILDHPSRLGDAPLGE